MEKKAWVKPKIMRIDSLPSALGSCELGSTDTGGNCQYGDATGVYTHTCNSGGIANYGCNSGTTAEFNGCSNGTTASSGTCGSGTSEAPPP